MKPLKSLNAKWRNVGLTRPFESGGGSLTGKRLGAERLIVKLSEGRCVRGRAWAKGPRVMARVGVRVAALEMAGGGTPGDDRGEARIGVRTVQMLEEVASQTPSKSQSLVTGRWRPGACPGEGKVGLVLDLEVWGGGTPMWR